MSELEGDILRMLVARTRLFAPPAGHRRGTFTPPVDVYETDDAFVVRAEIAGVRPEDIGVTVEPEQRAVEIFGRRENPAAGEARRFYNMEIETGQFYRRIILPGDFDGDGVTAKYSDGFLIVRLPKHPGRSRPGRRVPIQ